MSAKKVTCPHCGWINIFDEDEKTYCHECGKDLAVIVKNKRMLRLKEENNDKVRTSRLYQK